MGSSKRVLIVTTANDLQRIAEPVGLTTPVLSDNGTKPVWIEGDGLGGGAGFGEGSPTVGSNTAYVLPGNAIVGSTTGALAATGTRFYFPVIVREAVDLTALVGEVVSGQGATRAMRVGLYEADFAWQPGALVKEGALDASSTGVKTVAVSPAITLQPGRYLTCQHVNDVNPVWRIWQTWALWGTTGANGLIRTLEATIAYGTLPDPGTAWTVTSAGTVAINHRMVLQVVEP